MIKYELFDNKKYKYEDITKFVFQQDKTFPVSLSERTDIKKFVEKIVTKSIIVKAISNDEIIGMISFYANDKIKFKGYLTFLAVSIEYRNKGVASSLIDIMLNILKKEKIVRVELTTEIDNGAARKLYEQKGFVAIEKHEKRVRYEYVFDKEKYK